MGIRYYRRIKTNDPDTWVNVSKSGVSASHRVAKRVTVNTRGNVFIRTGVPGLNVRFNIFRSLFGRSR